MIVAAIVYAAGCVAYFAMWCLVVKGSFQCRTVESGGMGLTRVQFLRRDRNWLRFLAFVACWPIVLVTFAAYGAWREIVDLHRP